VVGGMSDDDDDDPSLRGTNKLQRRMTGAMAPRLQSQIFLQLLASMLLAPRQGQICSTFTHTHKTFSFAAGLLALHPSRQV